MASISMCEGHGCPIKTECARFTSKASEWQPFLVVSPYDHRLKECEMFIDNTKEAA